MTPTIYEQTRIEQFKSNLPRHLVGAVIAAGIGALAVAAGLWATNPGADAMQASIDAEPNVGVTPTYE